MRAFILALVAIIGCGAVANSNDYGVSFENMYLRSVYVKHLDFEGRSYHVFNNHNGIFVIDVTKSENN